jgi:hypothetical protein
MESGASTASRFTMPRGRALAGVLWRPQVVVGAIVLGAFLVGMAYTRRVSEFYVMPDELGYVKQAVGIARSHWLLNASDFYYNSYSQLEPLILAPAYALFDGLNAFDAGHAINAAAQASTAIPAYLLARRVLVWRPAAYLVALLTVITPWALMSGAMLSENATYPASMWGALAVERAIAVPSIGADIVALLAIGLAFFGRSQFYLLGVAFVCAVVIHEVLHRLAEAGSGERVRAVRDGVVASVRGHPVLLALGVLAGLLALFTSVWTTALGTYATVQGGQLLPPGTLDKGLELVENVIIAVACLPLALTLAWVPLALIRPRTRDQHAFASLLVVYLPLLVVALGSFSVRYTAGPNDRYMFYILPLLFIAMMAMLLEPRANRVLLLVGAGLTAWLTATAAFALTTPSMVALSSAAHTPMILRTQQFGRWFGIDNLRAQTFLAVLTVLATLVLILVRMRLRPALVASVVAIGIAGFTLAETVYTAKKLSDGQATIPNAAVDARAWIDHAIGSGNNAAVVSSLIADVGTTDAVLWETSFWNESVRNQFALAGGSGYDLGAITGFTIDDDGAIHGTGGIRYLAFSNLDRRFGIRGIREVTRHDPMILDSVPANPQLDWWLMATDDSGLTPAGKTTTLKVFGDGRARERRVALVLTPLFQAQRGYRYAVSGAGAHASGFVAPHKTAVATATVPVPAHGSVQLKLTTGKRTAIKGEPPTSGIVVLNVLTDPKAIAQAQRSAG